MKYSIQSVRDAISEQGWNLLTENYVNLDTVMQFQCPKGHNVFATWKRLRSKLECPECAKQQVINNDSSVLPKPVGVRRVLALDQASHTTGFAIFDNDKLVRYGSYNTTLNDEVARYSIIKSWVKSMVREWRPDYVAIEGIQFQEEGGGAKMGVTVFQTLARLQGVIMTAVYDQGIPFEVCPTNTWRHACGVRGKTRADRKRSMQMIVREKYGVSVSDDESDAIGIGLYITQYINKNTSTSNWES